MKSINLQYKRVGIKDYNPLSPTELWHCPVPKQLRQKQYNNTKKDIEQYTEGIMIPIKTIKFTVENSNTMEELEECSKLLTEKKRWLRRLNFVPDKGLIDLLFKDNDKSGIERYKESLKRLENASESEKREAKRLEVDFENMDLMMKEIENLQKIVTKKMKDIIWGK